MVAAHPVRCSTNSGCIIDGLGASLYAIGTTSGNNTVNPNDGAIKLISGSYYYNPGMTQNYAIYNHISMTYPEGAALSTDTVTKTVNGTPYECYYITYPVTFEVAHNLGLKDLVQIGYWVNATPNDGQEIKDYGLLVWNEDDYKAETNRTVSSTTAYKVDLTSRSGYMQGYGEGVFAQDLDTRYYAIAYVVTSDGSYIYSATPDIYAVPMYAQSAGFASQATEVHNAVRDLLNYATYAQYYFTSRSSGDVSSLIPINSVLTEELRASQFTDAMKVTELTDYTDTANNLTCTWKYSTANLEEAIQLNFFAEESTAFAGMLYWDEDAYAAAGANLVYSTATDVLTVSSRNMGSEAEVDMTSTAKIAPIYAKDIGSWQYACMYSGTDGSYTYGPIRVDSVAQYLTRMIEAYSESTSVTDEYLVQMCKNMLAYGVSAEAYAKSIKG